MIALAHDIHAETVYSLAQFMVDTARDQGYELVTVGDCLGDPSSNWYRDASTGGSVSDSLINSAASDSSSSSSSSGATFDRKVQTMNQDKAVQPGAGSGKITKIHAPGGPGGDRAASNSDHEDDDDSPRSESAAAKGFHVRSWIHVLPLLPSLVACLV